jgi:hypothetical protein
MHVLFIDLFSKCFYSNLVHSYIFEYNVNMILFLSTITILSFRILLFLTSAQSYFIAILQFSPPYYLPCTFLCSLLTCIFSKSFLRFHLYPRFSAIHSSLISSSRLSSRQQPPAIHSFLLFLHQLSSLPSFLFLRFFLTEAFLSSPLLHRHSLFCYQSITFSLLALRFSSLLSSDSTFSLSSNCPHLSSLHSSSFFYSSFLLRSYLNSFLS